MNKKKEIDKLARLTVLANFVNSKLKEQKTKFSRALSISLMLSLGVISVSIVKRLEKINLKFITIIKLRLCHQWN
jgi:hypothetical protein